MTLVDADRAKWRLEIEAEVTRSMSEGSGKGNTASIIARGAHAALLHEAMYARLGILSPHASTYKQDTATWFKGVLLDLEAVGSGPTPRAEVLRKRGICAKDAYLTFNSVFKYHWNRKGPRSGKAQYKRELMAAKLRHNQLTP